MVRGQGELGLPLFPVPFEGGVEKGPAISMESSVGTLVFLESGATCLPSGRKVNLFLRALSHGRPWQLVLGMCS